MNMVADAISGATKYPGSGRGADQLRRPAPRPSCSRRARASSPAETTWARCSPSCRSATRTVIETLTGAQPARRRKRNQPGLAISTSPPAASRRPVRGEHHLPPGPAPRRWSAKLARAPAGAGRSAHAIGHERLFASSPTTSCSAGATATPPSRAAPTRASGYGLLRRRSSTSPPTRRWRGWWRGTDREGDRASAYGTAGDQPGGKHPLESERASCSLAHSPPPSPRSAREQ